MTDHALIRMLQERYATMSGAHKRIADFLTGHIDEAAFLTAEALATRAQVSPATVVRFAVELGFQGFMALQQEMREMLVARISPGYRAARLAGDTQTGSPADVARQSLTLDLELVNLLLEQWDPVAMTEASRLLTGARQVLIGGFRISSPVARYLKHLLSRIRPGVQLLDGVSGDVPEEVMDIGSDDVLVAVAFGPTYWALTLRIAAWARQRGGRVVGITDSPLSPLSGLSDVAIMCPCQGLGLQFSLVPATMLVNALVNATIAAMPAGEAGVKERLSEIAALTSRWKLLVHDLPPSTGLDGKIDS